MTLVQTALPCPELASSPRCAETGDTLAFLTAWSWEPLVLTGLAIGLGLYLTGWRRLAARDRRRRVLPAPWRLMSFVLGILTIGIAFMSPIATYDEYFFFLHMLQHLLLIQFAAPLLLLGAPPLVILWGLPIALRRGLGRAFARSGVLRWLIAGLTHPLISTSAFVATIAVWHVPTFYDAAQGRTLIHDLEHGLFLGTALLFWWTIIQPTPGRRRVGYGVAIIALLPPFLECTLLGAILSLASRPLYTTYQLVPRVWGLGVLEDQQLGGIIMWVPSGLLYAIPFFILLGHLLNDEERATRARERPVPQAT